MLSRFSTVFAVAALLGAALVVPLSTSAAGDTIDSPGLTRLSGNDRYETSVAIAKSVFPSPEAVFLAAGTNYPDALSAGPAAAKQNGPVLLTASDSLPVSTAQELQRVAPATVFVLGGQSSVSASVATRAGKYAAQVVRLAGADRYATGVQVSKHFWATADVVYLASGAGYPDALSGGALAAHRGVPVLLSGAKRLPAVVAEELGRLGPSRVVLLGGTSSLSTRISAQVAQAVPDVQISRLSGQDRYGTSAAVAKAGWGTSSRVMYANGHGFPDALAGVPAAAANGAPLLLTGQICQPAPIADAAASLGARVKVLLGGVTSLNDSGVTTRCGAEKSGHLRSSINSLKVANESNASYDRSKFNHWIDADRDCQDTRDEVLDHESLVNVNGCNITTGKWFSYYDHQTWTNASDVDIDHMVPLAEAWGSGARAWNADTRQRYANDLGDSRALVAVTDNVNQSKRDRDPAGWLPQYNKCRYIGEWTAIKLRWNLTVDSSEKAKLVSVARTCPDTTLSWQKAKIVAGPAPTTPAPGPGMAKEADLLPPPPPDLDCSQIPYKNFLVRSGDPHRFDSDGDGIGCES